ncbi:TonB-dependent receptor [Nitrospirillum amazonense]|uniref:TonB-dependent receptor n=1 Tax=Nitrospirillum amazonense TaxID=28077 RepID=UPI002DD445DC|nr:TonB-dependent receptor [Nitrospirillum amazonense]MEC4590113.1 TonB-dependent receptor [Nitrospirillum amazonense]
MQIRHLLASAAALALMTGLTLPASAQQAPDAVAADTDQMEEVIVTSSRRSASEIELPTREIQAIMPGVNAVKAINMLPGVIFQNADPWGNNEQNSSLYIHGFNAQQLGYTLDGVPLGDQSYGNYNGLSPQRAIISENIGRISLASGAGDLGTASTSNLGGTLAVFSDDPKADAGAQVEQVFGSYDTFRTFARIDTGDLGGGNSGYVSFVRQDSRAWDFNGQQGGYQVNGKFVHAGDKGTLKAFFDWSDKVEPNEDATSIAANQAYQPYTRPFLYPDLAKALTYVDAKGNTPAALGANYSNYFSAAQRTDYLGYVSYDYQFSNDLVWHNQVYYHHDDGRGIVALPISGAASVFKVYYPTQDLKTVLGNTGYGVRTTEYTIDREGVRSNATYTLGDHQIEGGVWWEHNETTTARRWYQLSLTNPLTPYDVPDNALFTQVESKITNDVIQPYLQDQWQVLPTVKLQAGFKASLQFADGKMPVQPLPGSYSGTTVNLPQGQIDTKEGFLPQVGALWDITGNDQLFFNIQKNLRQYITYGLGGASPWSLGNQAAFDLFKKTGNPETSWTYEAGWRGDHPVDLGFITGIGGQINYYHVDFSNRQLLISPNATLTSFVGGVGILQNVGSVTTDGVDVAATVHLGDHFSVYDALSYNHSQYDQNYVSGASTVQTAGKLIPGDPEWMNRFIVSSNYGAFGAKVSGEYYGKRYATYTNDLWVPSYWQFNLEASYDLGAIAPGVKSSSIALNVTNLMDKKAASTITVGSASGTYAIYPLAPRQFFVTLKAGF